MDRMKGFIDLLLKILCVLLIVFCICVTIMSLSMMFGCDNDRVFRTSSVIIPDKASRWVPPYYDEYGTIIGARNDSSSSPVATLIHETGTLGLIAVRYHLYCPTRPPAFGSWDRILYRGRANYISTRVGPTPEMPYDGQIFMGPISWHEFPVEAGVIGGRFVAVFNLADSTLRGSAVLAVDSPCNPVTGRDSLVVPFLLVKEGHRFQWPSE